MQTIETTPGIAGLRATKALLIEKGWHPGRYLNKNHWIQDRPDRISLFDALRAGIRPDVEDAEQFIQFRHVARLVKRAIDARDELWNCAKSIMQWECRIPASQDEVLALLDEAETYETE